MPEVHNPPSLFGGEFRRRRGFKITELEASGVANVRKSLTHPAEDEIEVENCQFDDPRNIVVEDPVVVDRSRIVLELEEGGGPRRNRAEDWTARQLAG